VINYNVRDNNTLDFTLPADLISADYDIIICNPAGYTKASSQIALKVLKVVGVFEYNSLTLRREFLYDYAPSATLSLNAEEVVSINGDTITTIERFLTSN